MGFQFGTFSTDSSINISYLITLGAYQVDGFLQQNLAVDVVEFVAVVWKEIKKKGYYKV